MMSLKINSYDDLMIAILLLEKRQMTLDTDLFLRCRDILGLNWGFK